MSKPTIHICNYGGPHGEDFVSIECVEKTEYDKLLDQYEILENKLDKLSDILPCSLDDLLEED